MASRSPASRSPAAGPPEGPRPRSAPAGVVLAPGASAGRDQPALVALDQALTALGLAVERIDFPYRLAGRRAPDKAPVLIATIEEAAARLADEAGVSPGRLLLGGRSMGGRM